MDGKLRPMTAVYILQGEKVLLLYRVGSRVVAPSFCGEGCLEWAELDTVLERKMPHTAWHMLSHYLKEGRYTQLLYGGVTTENAVVFTPLEEF